MALETEKKSWMSHLPGILGGSAALVAALTTVYVNLRNTSQANAPTAVIATTSSSASAHGSAPGSATASASPVKMNLRLERILTRNDGSLGTTDWMFEVSAAGDPLYSLPVKSLDDREGKNLRMIPAGAPVSSVLDVSPAAATSVSIRGWKHGLLGVGGAPDVTGSGWLSSGIDSVTIDAKSTQKGGAEFVFYFSAAEIAGAPGTIAR